MTLFGVTLLVLLHQGYSLVQVTTVQLGEPVTLTCVLPPGDLSSKVHWYKQSAGETLKLIATLRRTTHPQYEREFSGGRLEVKDNKNISNLSIFRTIPEDEGMYHCAVMEWNVNTWSGTYLLLKGKTQRTSNLIVAQWPTVLDPVRPGDPVSLQCSVLSDSDKTCPVELSVLYFREGSNKAHPNIIYTDGKRQAECEKRSDTQKSCVYRFSKNVSSSDAGTYYCAVATCGEILFGNGATLKIETSSWSQTASTVIFLLCSVLFLIVIAVLIYSIRKNNSDQSKAAVLQKNFSDHKRQQNKDISMFSTVVFTMKKSDGCRIKDPKP
ncbi:signal-regulatory protein beta-2-like [Archocentrus centrarchus]|uniref:signal-regulatory protein beta-2-like n=1 Tax=Archocentrus centrarchus TaxID=63155 RepID=UPI0011EA4174|nr:signal-regulatory protein beta-2-like [Archocentrus centrarchus]